MFLIGVDGGGTKTAAWLGQLESGRLRVRGQGYAGPSNPIAVGEAEAIRQLDLSIAQAFQAAGVKRSLADAACFCIAGVTHQAEHPQVVEWLNQQAVTNRCRSATDVEAVLAAADIGDGDGIALIAGTGSIAWGKTSTGITARCGGWGHLLGDEGGGSWITLEALRYGCKISDGRAVESPLLTELLKAVGAADMRQLIRQVYVTGMKPAELAGLSRIVFELTAEDSAASAIISSGARQLAELVNATASKLGIADSGFVLALAGGNLVHYQQYRAAVIASLAEDFGLKPKSLVVENPVAGALRLAQVIVQE